MGLGCCVGTEQLLQNDILYCIHVIHNWWNESASRGRPDVVGVFESMKGKWLSVCAVGQHRLTYTSFRNLPPMSWNLKASLHAHLGFVATFQRSVWILIWIIWSSVYLHVLLLLPYITDQ